MPTESDPVRKVLVCEDNRDLSLLLRIALERDGHRVETIEDMRLFLHRTLAFAPDVILMDLRMPYTDGEEAVGILHADSRTAHIPIVLVSANAKAATVAANLGIPHVDKPFELAELRTAVQEALDPANAGELPT